MAKIPEEYLVEDKESLTVESLLDTMIDMYRELSTQINKKPDVYERDTDGQTTDTRLSNGSININSSTDNVQILTSHPTQSSVTWSSIGGVGGIVAFAFVAQSGSLVHGDNLTSSRDSTGVYRLTFETPMANTNYLVITTPQVNDVISVWSTTVGIKTTTDFVVKIKSLANIFYNPQSFNVIVIY